MTNGDNSKPSEDGFEYDGTFYRWHISDVGKDLILIDRFAQMPIADFFEQVDDRVDRGRAPILLALVATSIRAEHPDWSAERIIRLVMDLNLSDLVFVDQDAEEETLPPPSPPAEAEPTGDGSVSPLRSPSSAPNPERSATSSETRG
jgi:hypothetical protein